MYIEGNYIPYIWVNTLDSHYLRSTQFYDTLQGGSGFIIGFGARMNEPQRRALGVSFVLIRYCSQV